MRANVCKGIRTSIRQSMCKNLCELVGRQDAPSESPMDIPNRRFAVAGRTAAASLSKHTRTTVWRRRQCAAEEGAPGPETGREPGPPRSNKKITVFFSPGTSTWFVSEGDVSPFYYFLRFQSSKSSMAKTMGRALVLCALLALSLPRAGDPLSFHRISGVRVRVVSTIPRARRIDMLRRGRMTRRSLRRGGRRSARRRGAAQGATQLKGANSQI